MWEIVWSNGQLYDVCDEHARLQEAVRYDAAADGSLRPVGSSARSADGDGRHRSRRSQGSVVQ
jgi:hypothetical protein